MAQFLLQYQAKTEPIFSGGETVFEDKWQFQWSDPVRQRIAPALAIALLASGLTYVNAGPFGEATQLDKWYEPLSEPKRFKADIGAARQPYYFAEPRSLTLIEPTLITKWFNNLSEPRRFPRSLPPALNLAYATETAQFREVVFEDRWHFPWSEPVRLKRGLGASYQPFLAHYPPPIIPNPPSPPGAWFSPFSQPVMARQSLHASAQQFIQISLVVVRVPDTGTAYIIV